MNFVNEAVDIVDSSFNIVATDEWEFTRIYSSFFPEAIGILHRS